MRLHALLLVPALLVAGVAVPSTASAAATPFVGYVDVVDAGAGNLVRTAASGFRPGDPVTVTIGNRTSTPVAVVTTSAAPDGTVTLPADTRVPLSVRPDTYALTLTQSGGVTATSPPFGIQAPSVSFFPSLQPGRPLAAPGPGSSTIYVYGLANAPDVTRTVTIDGVTVTSQWYDDDRAFGYRGISIAVPGGLVPGDHPITFTQTGETPYTAAGTVAVENPSLSGLPTHTGTRPVLPLSIAPIAWSDDFDVTVVGAAGDRHAATRWTSTHGSDPSTAVTVSGTLSVGPATVTAVSRVNGAQVSGGVVVEPATVAAPSALAPDHWLASPDGRTLLVVETNGNVVQFHDGYAGWTSRTDGHPGARLTVQTDGNLVVRDAGGHAVWNSGTAGGGNGARLGFDATDTPVLTMANGRKAWSTFQPDGHRVAVGTLRTGSYLFQGQMFSNTPNAEKPYSVTLRLQTDGNLILDAYTTTNVWSTRTAGHPGAYLTFQTDGNLVLRAANGATLWANGVHDLSGAVITAQYNGDLAEFTAGGRLLWHLGTRGAYPTS